MAIHQTDIRDIQILIITILYLLFSIIDDKIINSTICLGPPLP